jgi:hypothetical protein
MLHATNNESSAELLFGERRHHLDASRQDVIQPTPAHPKSAAMSDEGIEQKGGSTPKRPKKSDTTPTPVRHGAGHSIPTPVRAMIGRTIPESEMPYYLGIEVSSDGQSYILFKPVEKMTVSLDSQKVLKLVDPTGDTPKWIVGKGRARMVCELINHKIPQHIAVSFVKQMDGRQNYVSATLSLHDR